MKYFEGRRFLGADSDNSSDYPPFGCYILLLVSIELFCWSNPFHSCAHAKRVITADAYTLGEVEGAHADTDKSLKGTFLEARKRLAAKLQNPRLRKISFHTFRRWKATMVYHYTRDPLYVMQFLGPHKA